MQGFRTQTSRIDTSTSTNRINIACIRSRRNARNTITRSEYTPQVDPQRKVNLPSAPPARGPPPPPPPPPPEEIDLSINISRRALAGIMVGGTLAWYAALKAGVPLAGLDRKKNIALLRTSKGNILAATQDEEGRLFLFDKAGNIYYDTEDPRLGIYIVDTNGDMYNEYVDMDGDIQQVSVGNIGDMTSVKVSEIGGVSVEQLQKSIKGMKGGRIVGFPKLPDEDGLSWQDILPPNAPASVPNGGGRVSPPPMLEDYEVELTPKDGKAWPSKDNNGGEFDVRELFKSLRRGDQ